MNIEQKHAVEGCLINREAMLRKLDDHRETDVMDDEEVRNDLEILRRGTNKPLFRTLNNDAYSAIDLNKDAPGAITFERIAEVIGYDDWECSPTGCRCLLTLFLDHPLNAEEDTAAQNVATIIRYAQERDDEDVSLMNIIRQYVLAENSWDHPLVLPVNLMLFMLKAPASSRRNFGGRHCTPFLGSVTLCRRSRRLGKTRINTLEQQGRCDLCRYLGQEG